MNHCSLFFEIFAEAFGGARLGTSQCMQHAKSHAPETVQIGRETKINVNIGHCSKQASGEKLQTRSQNLHDVDIG
jgi:hypothetical protein